jgi:hypothetical protein
VRVEPGHRGAGKPQQELARGLVTPVDVLVIGLVVIGHQAAVTGRDALGLRRVDEARDVHGQRRAPRHVEVHHLERLERDVRDRRRLRDEAREHARAALGRLVEEEAGAEVARGHRLGEHLALLELEHRLDAAQERVLHGHEGRGRDVGVERLEQERVLAVLHARHDPLARARRRVGRLVALVVVLRPGPEHGIDAEPELRAVRPASQALVEAGDGRSGAVVEPRDGAGLVEGHPLAHVGRAVAHGPLERGLQLEPLALSLLVVRGDALGRLRRDVLDAVDVLHDLGVPERAAARLARARHVLEVPRAARLADADGLRRQLDVRGRRVARAERELRPHDAVRAPLVVDEAARPELGEREEAGPLQVRLLAAAVLRGRHVRHERQSGEVVPGEEALRREVAVRVEVAR